MFLSLIHTRPHDVSDVAEVAECYLEEHESPSHLPSLLSALPRVADLVVRLKPKLISDPLLSPTSGQPYSYMHICRWLTAQYNSTSIVCVSTVIVHIHVHKIVKNAM